MVVPGSTGAPVRGSVVPGDVGKPVRGSTALDGSDGLADGNWLGPVVGGSVPPGIPVVPGSEPGARFVPGNVELPGMVDVPGSVPGIAERRIPWMWQARDLMQKSGLGGQPWKDVGRLKPKDPPARQAA